MMTLLYFKPKTAYEMRISDWSSDVCSSDLSCARALAGAASARASAVPLRALVDSRMFSPLIGFSFFVSAVAAEREAHPVQDGGGRRRDMIVLGEGDMAEPGQAGIAEGIGELARGIDRARDRKSTRLNSSH